MHLSKNLHGMHVMFAVRVKSRKIMVDQATNLSSSWSKYVFLSVVWLGNTIMSRVNDVFLRPSTHNNWGLVRELNRGSLTYSIHAYALVHEYAYFPRKTSWHASNFRCSCKE